METLEDNTVETCDLPSLCF